MIINQVKRPLGVEKLLLVVKWLIIGTVLAIGMFFVFRILDVVMAWQIYSWFFQPLVNSGIPETLSGAIAVWFMAAVMFILPTFIYSLLRNRSKALLIAATVVSAWFVVVYFISLPKEGQLFNPMTGKTMYRYSETPGGEIKLLPLGYQYDPVTGIPLKDLTPDVVRGSSISGKIAQILSQTKNEIPVCDPIKDLGNNVVLKSTQEVKCPGASARETRSCVLNTRLSAPMSPDNWTEATGKRLCFTPKRPAVDFEQVDSTGGTFWRFKAKEGKVLLKYRLMSTCPEGNSFL